MNRVESSAAHQVSDGMIEPLECGTGVQPVACTPLAMAALAVAAAGTAYYAFRDYNTSQGYIAPKGDMEALESITAQENHPSVSELTGAVRYALAE
jgi:hypothetical protein